MSFDKIKLLFGLVFVLMTLLATKGFPSNSNKVYMSYGEVRYTNGRLVLPYKIINDTSSAILIPEEYSCQKNPLVSRDVFNVQELGSRDALKYKGPFFNAVGKTTPSRLLAKSIVECEYWLNFSYSFELNSDKKYMLESIIRYRLPGEEKYYLIESEPYMLEWFGEK